MATTQIRGTSQIQDGTIADVKIAAGAAIQTSKLAQGANFIQKDGSVAFTQDQSHGGFKITNLADPVNPTDAANRQWVLANVAGGVVSSATAKASTNGLYVVSAGAWTRHTAMDAWAEVPGMIVSVQQGTVNGDTIWLSTGDAGGTLGTTAITFVQIPGPSDVTAGSGLLRTGQVIDIVAADNSLTVNPDSMQVKLDGARAVTVAAGGIGLNTDNTTVEINANAVRVKPASIGDTQLSATYQKQSNIVTRETPTGTINGANVTFALAATPIAGSEQIFLNGILQEAGAGNDYTIAGATITMLAAPATGDRLKANYLK